MGARNVSAVFVMWPELPLLPKLLLVGMGLQALDEPSAGRPARTYFGGEKGLMEITRRSRGQTYAALRVLREVGAVEQVGGGHRGARGEYRLALDPMATTGKGSGFPDVKGSGFPDGKGPISRTERVREIGPLGTTKEPLRNHGEDNATQETVSPAPVDNPSDETEIDAARAVLEGCAPDRYAAALQAAIDEGQTENGATIIRAAEIVKGNAA